MASIKKRFLANTGWQLVQQLYSMLLSLVIGSISARYLGPSNYGVLNYGASLINIFATIAALGLSEIIIYELVVKKDQQGLILGTAFLMQLLATIISVFCLAGIIVFLEPNNKLLWVVTILQSFQLFGNLYYVFNHWFQVNLKSKSVTIAYIIGLTVSGVWRIWLLMSEASVEFFAFTASLQGLIVLATVTIFFFRESKIKLHASLSMAKYLIKNSYHFIISALGIMIYMQMDKVMIGKILPSAELGYYSAATHIINLWLYIPKSIITSSKSIVLEGKNVDTATPLKNAGSCYEKRLSLLLYGMIAMGILAGVGFTVLGWIPIRVLYGEAYMGAVPALSVLIWASGLSMLGSVNSLWIVSEGYNKWLKYTVWAGAVVNLVCNAIMIPRLGILGAAIGTFMAQFTVQFIAPVFIPDLRKYFKYYKTAINELNNSGKYLRMAVQKVLRR